MIDGGMFLGRNPANGNELTATALISYLDSQGVGAAIVSSYKSIFFDDREGNKEVLALFRKYPKRIIPGVTINPLRYDALSDGKYLRSLKQAGARVLCLFSEPHYYEINWKSSQLDALLEEASRQGFTIQVGIQNEKEMASLLRLWNGLDAPLLIRWMGGGAYRGVSEFINAAKNFPNVYLDVASLTGIGLIDSLEKAVGGDRLYWASNAPEKFTSAGRFLLQASKLSAGAKRNVESRTLARLFGLSKPEKKPKSFQNFKKWSAIPKVDTHWHFEHWNLIEPQTNSSEFPALMKKRGIKKAIFSSIRALNGEMEKGNRDAFRWVEKRPGMHVLIVVDPTRPEESLRQIELYRDHVRCAGIKTIQDLYALQLDDRKYEPILRKISNSSLAVMAHLPGMEKAALRYPKLHFVAAHATYARARHLFGMSNVFFDLATSHRDVAETSWPNFLEEAGEDKLLFASDAPLMDPVWTLGKLSESGFSKEVLEKIFYQNAHHVFPRINL